MSKKVLERERETNIRPIYLFSLGCTVSRKLLPSLLCNQNTKTILDCQRITSHLAAFVTGACSRTEVASRVKLRLKSECVWESNHAISDLPKNRRVRLGASRCPINVRRRQKLRPPLRVTCSGAAVALSDREGMKLCLATHAITCTRAPARSPFINQPHRHC